MIKDYLGKKASEAIESSKLGDTKAGQTAASYLDTEKREAKTYDNFAIVTDEMQHSYYRRRIIVIALAVNLLSWLAVLFLNGLVSNLVLAAGLIFSKGGLLLILPAFSATMMGIYAQFRVLFPTLESNDEDDASVMQSYGRQEHSLKVWRIWVVSCGAWRKP